MAANVIFKFGTKAQYDALVSHDINTLYWLTDVQELYKGDILYGKGLAATREAAGLLSATDKAQLDALIASGIMNLEAIDASIAINSEEGKKTIGVQISEEEDNALILKDDGLFVAVDPIAVIPEYSMEKMGTAAEGYAATYRLKKTIDGVPTYVGDAINIPKDLVVKSGSVKTVTVDDEPYEGARVGDTYIDLELNDEEGTHIYIPTKGIIDISNKVDKQINAPDGSRALIFNEVDGGGAKFEHKDGTEAFVGVNNGGLNGLMAQIYADKMQDGRWVGSRINVYHDHIYYTSLASVLAGKARNAEECEIATMGDIAELAEKITWQEM